MTELAYGQRVFWFLVGLKSAFWGTLGVFVAQNPWWLLFVPLVGAGVFVALVANPWRNLDKENSQ